MQRNTLSLISLGLAVALVLSLGAVSTALSYERRVLFEDFTSTTCPPCAQTAPWLHDGFEMAGDLVVPIAWHMDWPQPGNDPWHHANVDDNTTRRYFYNVGGIPAYYVDGTVTNARYANDVNSVIRSRSGVSSPLAITLRGVVMENDILHVTVSLTAEQAVTSARLHVAINERYYYYSGPSGQRDHYDAMVKMLPDGNGTVFNIQAEQQLSFEFDQDLNAIGWHELEMGNLNLVAWVQKSNKEVVQSQLFEVDLNTPAILMEDWSIQDSDDDGRAEPGEEVEMTILLSNPPRYMDGNDVTVTLTTDDPGIEMLTGEFDLDLLRAGEEYENNNNPFIFSVAEDFEPHPVTFTVRITASWDLFDESQSFTFMIGWPHVLLVDASASDHAGEHVMGLFGNETLPYADGFNAIEAGITFDLLRHYDSVIWQGFNNAEPITEAEQDALIQYLDAGGILIMSGSHLANYLNDTELMRDYMGASVANADPGQYIYAFGDDGNPYFGDCRILLGGGDGLAWPAINPTLQPESGQSVMHYELNAENLGSVAVEHITGRYQTLLLAFPIESIGGVSHTETIDEFMPRLWNWIREGLAAPEDGEPVVYEFELLPAYPNPFNSTAVVPYSLSSTGNARLGIYDLRGRLVGELFNGTQNAGTHRLTLNAADLNLSNGFYYLRLDAGTQQQSSGVLFLR